jgi:hypothetical protein
LEDPEVASPQKHGAAPALPNPPDPGLVAPRICTCLWCGAAFEPRLDGGSPVSVR